MKRRTLLFIIFFITTQFDAFAQGTIDLRDLGIENSALIWGTNDGDNTGYTLVTGDFNGDGIDDILTGAPFADVNSVSNAGKIYVMYGDSTFKGEKQFSDLNGTTGLFIEGSQSGALLGLNVHAADVNDDGFDDLIFTEQKKIFTIFGKSGIANNFDLSTLNGQNGFVIEDLNFQIGHATSTGDINGDGKSDIIIGLSGDRGEGETGSPKGMVHVVYGDTSFSSSMSIEDINGTNGFSILGEDIGDEIGTATATGDINGDNFDDILIAADVADASGFFNAGEILVVFGATVQADTFFVAEHLNGSNGFRIPGEHANHRLGSDIATADIDGDGKSEFLVTGSIHDVTPYETILYVFGGGDIFPDSLGTSASYGPGGLIITSDGENINKLHTGDFNSDGLDDIAFMRPTEQDFWYGSNEINVIFGSNLLLNDDEFAPSDIYGKNGYTIQGVDGINLYNNIGISLATGDINGDGSNDFLFSAIGSPYNGKGRVYLHFIKSAQLVNGDQGYRMFSAPSNGSIYSELIETFWTQGFEGADLPDTAYAANVWKWSTENQEWKELTSIADSLAPGEGFLMYVFADDNNDGNVEGFPKTISASQFGANGNHNSGDIDAVTDLGDGEYALVGNPFSNPIDWDYVTTANLSNTIYLWNDATSSWLAYNGITGDLGDGEIAPFQSFFVQGSGGNGTLTIPESAVTDSVVGLSKEQFSEDITYKFSAISNGFASNFWVSFHELGELGYDSFDGNMLKPLSENFLSISLQTEDGTLLKINSLPDSLFEILELPLIVKGNTGSDEILLTLETEEMLKHTLLILDTQNGKYYDFSIDRNVHLVLDNESLKHASSKLKHSFQCNNVCKLLNESRYKLIVKSGVSIPSELDANLPISVSLSQNYPNPFNPSTTINFTVPQRGNVRMEVFDMLGRKVAVLLNEIKTAGKHSINFDSSQMASGLYIYRLQVGKKVLSKKMTLIK